MVGLALVLLACGQPGHVAAHRPGAGETPEARNPDAGQPPVMAVAEPTVRPLELPSSGPPGPPGVYDLHAAPPIRVRVPAIGVDSGLSRLGLNQDGTIEVPANYDQAGWYAKGPAPGEAGPAVIIGHLDSATGPAVFARLGSLRTGSEVLVGREDGSQVRFLVDRVESFPSDAFPTAQVYGATTRPVLRLITCGGQFNLIQRRYSSNVVAFATEAA